MARRTYTAEDVIEFIAYIKGGDAGRGSSFGPSTGLLEALREDRQKNVDKMNRSRPKRRPSKSQLRYGRAFKRLSPKYKKKNGSWKKDGFKRCVRAAHRDCRRKH